MRNWKYDSSTSKARAGVLQNLIVRGGSPEWAQVESAGGHSAWQACLQGEMARATGRGRLQPSLHSDPPFQPPGRSLARHLMAYARPQHVPAWRRHLLGEPGRVWGRWAAAGKKWGWCCGPEHQAGGGESRPWAAGPA